MVPKRIAVLGTGLMGAPMAKRLAEREFEVVAYNRSPEKALRLAEEGVTVASSVTDAIRSADSVVTMLSDAAAIRAVLSLAEPDAFAGRTFIQMSTISPQESVALEKHLFERGSTYIEAPVLGSVPEATSGQLIVMVGGPEELFLDLNDLWLALGVNVLRVGGVGSAAALKLAMNQLIASLTSAFALSLGFIGAHGINVDQFMDVVRSSALYAPTYDKKLSRMLKASYDDPNFPLKHLYKDVNLFVSAAREVGMQSTTLDGVASVLAFALEESYADSDYSAVFEVISSTDK